MIPMHYHQRARQIHQERIQAATQSAPEWPSPTTPRSALWSHADWSRIRLLARWPTLAILRIGSRQQLEQAN